MTNATVEVKAYKGHYVAGIDGESGRFGLERDFTLDSKVVKSRKVRSYTCPPGWYEQQTMMPVAQRVTCETCGHRADGKIREYFGVSKAGEVTYVPSTSFGDMHLISAGPVPGEDGAYAGAHCFCGADVDSFDVHGFPFCREHTQDTSAAATDTEGLVA